MSLVDGHTLAALEFPRVRERVHSLLRSDPGRRAAAEWGPAGDAGNAGRLLEETSQMREVVGEAGEIDLGGVIVPDDLLAKARPEGAVLSAADLLSVLTLCRAARKARTLLVPRAARFPFAAGPARDLPVLNALEKAIDAILDDDGDVRDSASAELAAIRRGQAAVREDIQRLYRGLLARGAGSDLFQDDIVATRRGRFALLVKAQHRHRLPGILLDRTDSGQAVYLEPQEAVPLNNRLAELAAEEEAEKRRLLGLLTDAVRHDADGLEGAAILLGALDLLQARALHGLRPGWARPLPAPQGRLRLVEARHPVLEEILGEGVIPLSLDLPEGVRALVVTGPNTGGKTVALKTAGLLCLMAQAGLWVPAGDGTELPVFARIHCDIGDEQSLEQSLSTFSGHVRNIAAALAGAGPGTLVILDELGAGTDPAEGAPLAMAIVEALLASGALTLASTHQGALVAFAARTPGALNASMEFDGQTLRPTYRMVLGVPGRSNAREVARRMGIPEAVVLRSLELQPEAQRGVDDLVTDLDRRRRELEAAAVELARARAEAEALREKARGELETLRQERAGAAARLRLEAQALLRQTRREVGEIVASARTSGAEAHRRLHLLRGRVEEQIAEAPEGSPAGPVRPPAVGQRVRLPGSGTEGIVTWLSTDGRTARVAVGGKTIEVGVVRLEAAPGFGRGVTLPPSYGTQEDELPSLRLDVRGLRGDEAETEIVRFLDRAWLAGAERAEVLHGKGHGRLKELTARLAADHPGVSGSSPAAEEAGGAGVTIISFRS